MQQQRCFEATQVPLLLRVLNPLLLEAGPSGGLASLAQITDCCAHL